MKIAAIGLAWLDNLARNKKMPTDNIFNKTIALLERSLNLRSLNHRVLASNIANMDTPNYKAFELVVAEEMNKNRRSAPSIPFVRTHFRHLPVRNERIDNIKFRIANPPDFSLRGDGNTVDVDRTMGKLAKNTLLYNAATQLISGKFRSLKNVINGGRQ
jgi:flagellar basal-body rod protein FlgB